MVLRVRWLIGFLVVSLFLVVISLTGADAAVTAPQITVLAPPITDGVKMPIRMVFDAKGYLLVADPRVGGVSVYNGQGSLQQVVNVQGVITGLAVDSKGNLLVAKGRSVVIMDRAGAERGALGSGAGQFGRASGIAVDAAGFVYVVDNQLSNVKVFTAAGAFVKTIGAKGSGNGQFNAPTGIAYESASNQIAVADTGNGRIQFFSAGGNFDYTKTIGSFGTAQLQFRTPVGIAFEYAAGGGVSRMYVVDTYQNNVQILDPAGTGRYLATIGASGFASGELMIPVDVAFDKLTYSLLVANNSGMIARFGIDGGSAQAAAVSQVQIDPVPYRISSSTVTISGTVAAGANVVVKTTSSSLPLPVTYTSASTWKCNVSGLAQGVNTIMVNAVGASGVVEKHAVGVIYWP